MMLFYIMQVFVIIPLFSYSGMFLLWNPPAYRRPPDWTYFFFQKEKLLCILKKGTLNGECACMIQMQPKGKKIIEWIYVNPGIFALIVSTVTTVYRLL